MHHDFTLEFGMTYTDADVDFIREQRKFWARREQETLDKKERKFCQRYVKATTIVIDYITGGVNLRYPFPTELTPLIKTVFSFATNDPATHFKDLYK